MLDSVTSVRGQSPGRWAEGPSSPTTHISHKPWTPRPVSPVLRGHLTLEGREADGSDSQLAWSWGTHRIRFAPWQDVGTERQAGEPRTAQPGPHVSPNTHLLHVRNPPPPSKSTLPQAGGRLVGSWEGAGGDTQAWDPVLTPGREPPPTCSESEKETQSSTPAARMQPGQLVCKEH